MKQWFLVYFCLMFAVQAYAEDKVLPLKLDVDSSQKIQIEDSDLDFNITEDAFGNKLMPQLEDEPSNIKVDTSRSLSENIKNNASDTVEKEPKIETPQKATQSWVKSLFKSSDSDKTKSAEALKNLVDESQKKPNRSNASVFDIAGVMLRMSYVQAEAQLLKRGYKKVSQKMDIPNFIRWRNEEKCRNQGVVGYERLDACIIKLAKNDNYQYVSQATFNKFETKETVQIFLSSTFTNNKVYKVTYQTEAANNTGNSTKAVYLRNLKVYDFWKQINQKYGNPDNRDEITWGLGADKPYLKAATGFLLLEDPTLQTLDVNRMSREDQRYIHTNVYNF